MSIFLASDLPELLGDLIEEDGCFRCSGSLRGQPIVLWAGYPGRTIALHPECARALGSHLIQDSREADIAAGGQIWTSRGIRALRAGLMVQEGLEP